METHKYRVECIDPNTGKTAIHGIESVSIEAARDLATRMGYVVRDVTRLAESPLPATSPRARWSWLVCGLSVGILGTLGALYVMGLVPPREIQSSGDATTPQKLQALNAGASPVTHQPASTRDEPPSRIETLAPEPERSELVSQRPAIKPPLRRPLSETSVNRAYDKFDDVTTFAMPLIFNWKGPDLELFHVEKGNVEHCQSMPFRILIGAKYQKPRKADDLVFLVDGRRIRLEPHDDRLTSAGYHISYEDLLAVANASDATGRIGGEEFVILKQYQTSIRDFLSYLAP